MKSRLIFVLFLLFVTILNTGCGSDNKVAPCTPVATTAYEFDLPAHFSQFAVPGNNLTTMQGVALGKRLYYDKMLSEGGPMEGRACASCHLQANSFTSSSLQGRSVMVHLNLAWTSFYLWDGKISGSLEEVMDFEIAEFFKADIDLFKADPVYQSMNCDAFGSSDISRVDMANAMAQWMRTMLSYRSRYDRYVAGEVELTDLEQTGEFLFNGALAEEGADCSKCHTLPLTTDNLFHNNGLEIEPTGSNLGRFNVTGDPVDTGWFKTPTLRNIELTAPYMHDGRFETLEDVINHYNQGVLFSDHLDPVMVTPTREYNLRLSDREIAGLVAYLKIFTDTAYTTDSEFADPFK